MDITLAQVLAAVVFGAGAVIAAIRKEAAIACTAAGLFLLALAKAL